ncbi:DUF3878 family protein [Blautia sp. HCP3S3_G3]|uniref:DUF3878 family protein n=1 Tax=Blautia sp. HCP3S3_G3 TaxID=3438913 RepID=UPI003F8CD554
MDTFIMLQELLEQNQFELICQGPEIRLVYLMNDAAESFLVFQNAVMTGNYKKNYEGKLNASLNREEETYILSVYQGDTVVTLFFTDLMLDVRLYDYSGLGHFWVKGYEYLRQLEYRIAILRDKRDYLGEEYCTQQEQKLAALADFPPLNYCCYPAVPEKYIVPRGEPWQVSEEAIAVMEELTDEVHDRRMKRMLGFYRRHPNPFAAKKIARMLHRNAHAELTDLLTEKLCEAAAVYPVRSFGEETDRKYAQIIKQAQERQELLKRQGRDSVLLLEQPFVTAADDMKFQVHLMIWKRGWINRRAEVESFR